MPKIVKMEILKIAIMTLCSLRNLATMPKTLKNEVEKLAIITFPTRKSVHKSVQKVKTEF